MKCEVLPDLARYAPLTPVAGCAPIVAHQARDLFALWGAWEGETGERERVPFWGVVWPAARVLARWVLDSRIDVKGRTVLDLGCGGGVVAVACALAGASDVTANDIDGAALEVAARNAAANHVSVRCSSEDVLAQPSTVRADVVLVADFFYEKTQAEHALRTLRILRQRGARVLIADAGRPFSPASGLLGLGEQRVDVDRELEGVNERVVRVFEL